jgi:microcin C transport system permease protein
LQPEELQALKKLYGFDQPPLQRFGHMLAGFARFDLGDSFFHHQSVAQLILSKLPVSMSIGLWTFFITYLLCIPLGIAKAVRDGSLFDLASSTVILLGYAIPVSCWGWPCWCCLAVAVSGSCFRCAGW